MYTTLINIGIIALTIMAVLAAFCAIYALILVLKYYLE